MPSARKSHKNALQDATPQALNRKPYSHEDQFPHTSKKPRTTATEPDFLTEVILPGETAVQSLPFEILIVGSSTSFRRL